MKIVNMVSVSEPMEMAQKTDGSLIKAYVDIAKKIVIIDMPMHFNGEQNLLKQGSLQNNLRGINLFPADYGTDSFNAYDSIINIKPRHGNPSMSVKSKFAVTARMRQLE